MKVSLRGAKSACLLNLNEEKVGNVYFRNGKATLSVGPRKIVTLGFEVK